MGKSCSALYTLKSPVARRRSHCGLWLRLSADRTCSYVRLVRRFVRTFKQTSNSWIAAGSASTHALLSSAYPSLQLLVRKKCRSNGMLSSKSILSVERIFIHCNLAFMFYAMYLDILMNCLTFLFGASVIMRSNWIIFWMLTWSRSQLRPWSFRDLEKAPSQW